MTLETLCLTLQEKKYLSDDILLMTFDKPKNFTFTPGQFINIKLQKDDELKFRSYSLLNPPSEPSLKIVVKLIDDGFASDIFKSIQPGTTLDAKGPLGTFVFDHSLREKRQWLIAGGTGVAPYYSMLKTYLQEGIAFTLLFSVKTKDDLFFHQDFLDMEDTHTNFTYHPTLTREEWDGKTGRVQQHLPQNKKDKVFYLCGVKDLVVETKRLLESDVDTDWIKCERYT